MGMICTALMSVDSALRRLDYDLLSDQTLMEMLIDGMDIEEKSFYQDESGNFLDTCEWPGVECTESESDDDRVVKIILNCMTFSAKQFPFNFIPPMVSYFDATNSNVHGTLETSHLPPKLTVLFISFNKLHGPLNLANFPRQMELIEISGNKFCGSLQLADLPHSLKDFSAECNQFSGEISLNDLPPAMETLLLSENLLTGSINIERLPQGMNSINLSKNSFLGTFRLMAFPENLSNINVRGNEMRPIAVLGDVKSSVHKKAYFRLQGLASAVDEDGNVHAWSAKPTAYRSADANALDFEYY